MTQQHLFCSDYANALRACTLARRDDPETSKQAARRMVESGRLTKQQRLTLVILERYGPGTAGQLAMRQSMMPEPGRVYYMLARRLPELEREGLARVKQDLSKPCRCKANAKRCRCRDVVHDGSRCWEVVP